MKISASFLLLTASSVIFACQRPANLRDGDPDLALLRKLQKEGATKMYMFNYAIAWDDVKALEILFSRGNVIQYEDETLNQTDRCRNEVPISLKPLHLAAQYGSLEVIAFCLARKADINSRTHCQDAEHHYQTPAHWAAIHSQHAALSKLLDCGADTELKDSRGRTVETIIHQKEDITAYGVLQAHKAKIAKQ